MSSGGCNLVRNQLVDGHGTGNTGAMTHDREALAASWKRTRTHLDAARAYFAPLPGIDLSTTTEFLDHNELGLAFDCMAHLADDLGLPLDFWRHMDRAAREMRLYSDEPHMPHREAADSCLRHLAAASGRD
ncbi:MafI family immunity protein [Streptomyces parvus]|nr:MafI family immunity protein [Streptomyces parvus]